MNILLNGDDGDWPIYPKMTALSDAQTIKELKKELEDLRECANIAINAMEAALNNYGRMLLTHPPKAAWDYNCVNQKLTFAIAALKEQK